MNRRYPLIIALLLPLAFAPGCEQALDKLESTQDSAPPKASQTFSAERQEPTELEPADLEPVQAQEMSPTTTSTAPLVPITAQATVETGAPIQPQAAPFQPQPINICSFNVQCVPDVSFVVTNCEEMP